MVNFIYLIGDRLTRECVVVDPAYAVDDILRIANDDDMTLTGVLATHYHPDHVGGSMMGHTIEGVSALLEKCSVPVHIQADEAPWVMRTTGLGDADLVSHTSGDVVSVGDIDITLLHTPGHTPGSQCFMAGNCAGAPIFDGTFCLYRRSAADQLRVQATDTRGMDELVRWINFVKPCLPIVQAIAP